LSQPQEAKFGPDGNLYVTGFATNDVKRFNGSTGAFMNVFASGGSLTQPYGLAFGPDNNLYVSSFGANVVKQYNGSTGAFIKDFASTANPTQLIFVASTPSKLSALTLTPTSVIGGKSLRGLVGLSSAAPAGGITVTLSSSSAKATLPASVTIPEGGVNASFTIRTTGVTSNTAVTITAAATGVTLKKTLTLKPNAPKAVLLSSDTVASGDSLVGTVVLEVPAGPGGVVVTLTSSSASATLGSPSITILEGAASGSFTVTAGTVTEQTVITISAKANNVTKTTKLTVNP
jgi:hypothetical protein